VKNVCHYQVRQSKEGEVNVLLLPENPATTNEMNLKLVSERLGNLLGKSVNTSNVQLITPEDSGKFRLTACVA
jgi:hypothetical protein